jgi:hypothetical protein
MKMSRVLRVPCALRRGLTVTVLVASTMMVLPAMAAAQNLVVNGSFTSPLGGGRFDDPAQSGDPSTDGPPGWHVVGLYAAPTPDEHYWGEVEVTNGPPATTGGIPDADGDGQALNLDTNYDGTGACGSYTCLGGVSQGTVYQDIPTTPGHSYQLSFAYAGNPTCGSEFKDMAVYWNGQQIDTTQYDSAGHGQYNIGWQTKTEPAQPASSGSTTRLEFTAMEPDACGPMVDAVDVEDLGAGGGSGGGGMGGGTTGGNFNPTLSATIWGWQCPTPSYPNVGYGNCTFLGPQGTVGDLRGDVFRGSNLQANPNCAWAAGGDGVVSCEVETEGPVGTSSDQTSGWSAVAQMPASQNGQYYVRVRAQDASGAQKIISFPYAVGDPPSATQQSSTNHAAAGTMLSSLGSSISSGLQNIGNRLHNIGNRIQSFVNWAGGEAAGAGAWVQSWFKSLWYHGQPVVNVGIDQQSGDTIIAAGSGNIIAAGSGNLQMSDGEMIVARVLDSDGNLVAIISAGSANAIHIYAPIISAGSANIISAGSANIIAAGSANIISAGSANIIAAGGANIVAAGGANWGAGPTGHVAVLRAFASAAAGGAIGAIPASFSEQPGVVVSATLWANALIGRHAGKSAGILVAQGRATAVTKDNSTLWMFCTAQGERLVYATAKQNAKLAREHKPLRVLRLTLTDVFSSSFGSTQKITRALTITPKLRHRAR